jgi:hypothetical protein
MQPKRYLTLITILPMQLVMEKNEHPLTYPPHAKYCIRNQLFLDHNCIKYRVFVNLNQEGWKKKYRV